MLSTQIAAMYTQSSSSPQETETSHRPTDLMTLLRRKGGRRGGGGKGRSRGSSSSSLGSGSGRMMQLSYGLGRTIIVSRSSDGSKKTSVTPSGQPFAGRQEGGGTRANVYGTSAYGSGYPRSKDIGVSGRDFPFYFHPVVWPSSSRRYPYYISNITEYGTINNSSRPGGPLMQLSLQFSLSLQSNTFRVVTDNATAQSLAQSLGEDCGKDSTTGKLNISVVGFNDPIGIYSTPEQAIQYYRASSVVLTLDGYNNTAIFNTLAPYDLPSALPSSTNVAALSCINGTIGSTVLLVSDASLTLPDAYISIFAMIIACFFYLF